MEPEERRMVSTPSLPPGPRPTPWGLYQVIHEPGPLIAEQIRRYGDPFTERFVGFSTVFSCNPEAARRLLTADPDLFEVPNPDQLVPLLGKDSVLFLIGARHRAERKLLNPHFHGGRMRAYGQLIREITRRQLAAWRVSDRFRMLDTTQAISLEVILGAVFGVDSDRLNDFRTAVLDFVPLTNSMRRRLSTAMSAVGTKLLVDCRGKNVEAVVVPTPFYKRK